MVEHQGVEPWHRSPGLSHFESLNRLEETGFVRLSLAVVGIFCASQKWHISAIYRQKSTTFCEVPLEKPPFTQSVRGNYHLQDKKLSLKAKGLLSYMLSLPDD